LSPREKKLIGSWVELMEEAIQQPTINWKQVRRVINEMRKISEK
jgi:hypothetical protein